MTGGEWWLLALAVIALVTFLTVCHAAMRLALAPTPPDVSGDVGDDLTERRARRDGGG